MSTIFIVKIPDGENFHTVLGTLFHFDEPGKLGFSIYLANYHIFRKLPGWTSVVALSGSDEGKRTIKDLKALITKKQKDWLKSPSARDYILIERGKRKRFIKNVHLSG